MTIREDGLAWARLQPGTSGLRQDALSLDHKMAWSFLAFGGGMEAERRGLKDGDAGEFLTGLYEFQAEQLFAGSKERRR